MNKIPGLKSFLLRTNFFEDLRVRKLNVNAGGSDAVSIFLGTLCVLYKQGYYLPWEDEVTPASIAQQLGFCTSEQVSEAIRQAVTCGLFDEKIFNDHKVLTSKDIQECYKQSLMSRRGVMLQEFSLLEPVSDGHH